MLIFIDNKIEAIVGKFALHLSSLRWAVIVMEDGGVAGIIFGRRAKGSEGSFSVRGWRDK